MPRRFVSFVILLLLPLGSAQTREQTESFCEYSENSSDACSSSLYQGTCCIFSLYMDFICWRTRRCSLDYAELQSNTDGLLDIDVKALSPGHDNGFRVGGVFERCNFYVEGVYTSFCNSERDSTTNQNGFLLWTRNNTGVSNLEQGNFALAESHWNIRYHTGEILFGYQYDYRKCFGVQLFTGLKMAFIEQKIDTLYSEFLDVSEAGNVSDEIKQKVEMDGYGATAGFRIAYSCNRCLSLIGGFSYDILASYFDRKSVLVTSNGDNEGVIAFRSADDCSNGVSVFNYTAGIQYDTKLCGCYDICVSVGYEFHHYLNFPDFLELEFYDTMPNNVVRIRRESTDLDFDGIFLRVGCLF